MSSNLKVNTILPSVGSNIGIGTNGGELNVDGGCKVQVGTALTLGHSIGLQYATQNLHSAGFEINQINASGIVTASHFYGNGANLTALNASNISSGTVPSARLGSGTASSSTFLAGDSTFKTITGTTINNNADNRIITGSGTANTLNGESGVTIDGSNILSVLGSGQQQLNVGSTNAGGAAIVLDGDSNGDGSGGDYSLIRHNTDGDLEFYARSTGGATNTIFKQGTTERLRITSNGLQKITQSANITDGSFYSTITISSPNGIYQGLRFDRGNVAKWRIGMKNDDTFQIANLFHNGSAGAEDNCVRITDNDDINITGNLKISTAGNGISFAADANGGMTNSEVLDDYEEGYYYPAAYGTSSTTSAYYYSSENKLGYVKIGKLVTIMGRLRLQADNYGGGLRMTLPYAAVQGSNTSNSAMSAVGTHGVNFDSDDMGLFIEIFPNTSYADFIVTQDNQGWINATNNYISAKN